MLSVKTPCTEMPAATLIRCWNMVPVRSMNPSKCGDLSWPDGRMERLYGPYPPAQVKVTGKHCVALGGVLMMKGSVAIRAVSVKKAT